MSNNFANNLRYLREKQNISQNKLGELVGVNQTTIGRWETNEITPSIDNVEEVAKVLKVPLPDLIIKNLRIDNATILPTTTDTIQIPVLGIIKAGIPIEAQQDILEYIDIPKEWIKGDKTFFALKISGDSMYPIYEENDIVIFEQKIGIDTSFNRKDCCVMVNGNDATFKKVLINESGIILQPYNDKYEFKSYTPEEIEKLPISITGIAIETRRRKKYEN